MHVKNIQVNYQWQYNNMIRFTDQWNEKRETYVHDHHRGYIIYASFFYK